MLGSVVKLSHCLWHHGVINVSQTYP
jgi:hypothetical protein